MINFLSWKKFLARLSRAFSFCVLQQRYRYFLSLISYWLKSHLKRCLQIITSFIRSIVWCANSFNKRNSTILYLMSRQSFNFLIFNRFIVIVNRNGFSLIQLVRRRENCFKTAVAAFKPIFGSGHCVLKFTVFFHAVSSYVSRNHRKPCFSGVCTATIVVTFDVSIIVLLHITVVSFKKT